MSKEEFLKIQTCVLKVSIDCEGCKQKVKKILQKIDGVYTVKIDSDQGKVTVCGNVDAATLVKKLSKNGKYAEVCGISKSLPNQVKNLQIGHGKPGGNDKGNGQKDAGGNHHKGGAPLSGGNVNLIQQMKAIQDLQAMVKLKEQNHKPAKLDVSEEEDLSEDDEDDDFSDEDEDYSDDESEDEEEKPSSNKMKPAGKGHPQMPHMLMNGKLPVNGGGHGGGNAVKGGVGGVNIPFMMNGPGGKGGGNHNQGGGKGGGGGNGNHGGGVGAANFTANGAHKGGGGGGMPNMMGQSIPMGHMPPSRPMGGNLPAVQGLPAHGGVSSGGYYNGGAQMPGNSFYQQQLAAMMNNNQRADNFQPYMYARPPPSVNYMQPYPPYYPPPPGERLDHYNMFSDENTSSCNIM